jgi:TRAP-type C4-dicarboxylate transport system permease small subunit
MEGGQMTPTQRTLLVIAIFVALIVGSFIWFIITWDPSQEAPVSSLPATGFEVLRA